MRRGPPALRRPAFAVAAMLVSDGSHAAPPVDIPRFNVELSCSKLVGTADPKAPMRNLCIQREQQGYDIATGLWAAASAQDKAKCAGLAETSRSYKYVYLAACLRSSGRTRELSTPQKFRY